MTLAWGIAERERRRIEDAQFPAPPQRGSFSWQDYSEMRRQRAGRRKKQGFSRAMADYWVAQAERAREDA